VSAAPEGETVVVALAVPPLPEDHGLFLFFGRHFWLLKMAVGGQNPAFRRITSKLPRYR